MNLKAYLEDQNLIKMLNSSHLTKKQFYSLLIYKKGHAKLFDRDMRIDLLGKAVTKGSFYRTLSQARENVRKSIVTIILLCIFQIIDSQNISNLENVFKILSLGDSLEEKVLLDKLVKTIMMLT